MANELSTADSSEEYAARRARRFVAIVAVMAAPQTREKMLNLVQLKTAN